MPLISPLVKCAVALLGKKKKSIYALQHLDFKNSYTNYCVLKSIWQSKLSHCFHVLLPLSASILNFISCLDCQYFGSGTALSVSLWGTLLNGSRPGVKKTTTFTIIMQIHNPKVDYLQGPCVPNWKRPFLLAFQYGQQQPERAFSQRMGERSRMQWFTPLLLHSLKDKVQPHLKLSPKFKRFGEVPDLGFLCQQLCIRSFTCHGALLPKASPP